MLSTNAIERNYSLYDELLELCGTISIIYCCSNVWMNIQERNEFYTQRKGKYSLLKHLKLPSTGFIRCAISSNFNSNEM